MRAYSGILFLGLLLSVAVFRSPLRLSRVKKIVLIIVLLFVFALGDEFRQSLVDLRTASVVDVGLDMVGGMIGMMIVLRSTFYVLRSRFNVKKKAEGY